MTVESFNIVYIGAGNITFGNDNVLWNHSVRVEALLGSQLRVVAIIDPNKERVDSILSQKAAQPSKASYTGVKFFSNVEEATPYLKAQQIDLFIVGAPPYFRGTQIEGRNLELEILNRFGTSATIFSEKPVAATRPEEPLKLSKILVDNNVDIGVAYMMRYLKVVQKAMSIIRDNNLVVMDVAARYGNAYQRIRKVDWWTKSQQGGPIIEQATHFCDLMRYIAGDVDLDSVKALSVEYYEKAGKLSHQAIDESKIPEHDRVPRATAAIWKFKSGAVGLLTHAVAMHGIRYLNEITIWADGYQLRIQNVYTDPTLYVRSPASDTEETVYKYPNDDPFQNELQAFISHAAYRSKKNIVFPETVEIKDAPPRVNNILSSYDDACQTFALTWRIRDQSEANATPRDKAK